MAQLFAANRKAGGLMVLSGTNANLNGIMLVVVGPSGVGKDSVINALREQVQTDERVSFVQRFVTRPSDAGGEDHVAVTQQEFEALEARNEFAVSWQAHGLSYGVPTSAATAYGEGKSVIVNGSRAALQLFAERFANIVVVNITADPEVIAQRLASRGREDAREIALRIRRGIEVDLACSLTVQTIDNSGDLQDAVDAFLAMLKRLEEDRKPNIVARRQSQA